MIICFFGQCDTEYSRNHILIKGLLSKKIAIKYCLESGWWLIRWWKLFWKQWLEVYDVIFIPYRYLSAVDIILGKVISILRNKPLIFDAYISLYDTYINDRKLFSPLSLQAKWFYGWDWLSFKLADHVITDTEENAVFISLQYGVLINKITPVYVGTDENLFFPLKTIDKWDRVIKVGYWGNYLPLHGVKYIVKAAKKLEDKPIQFNLLGNGGLYKQIVNQIAEEKLINIKLYPPVPYEQLADFIRGQDIVLAGPFANTSKSNRVIPNKVYEALACNKPTIVGKTPTMASHFNNQEVMMCELENSIDLANKIMELVVDQKKATSMASNGYSWFNQHARMVKVAEVFKKLVAIYE